MSGTDPTPIRPAEAIREALDNPQDAPMMAPAGDYGPELGDGDRRERPPFPPGCPVTPLGIASDIGGTQRCFYLNWNGQAVGLEANNRHGKLGLIALFGPASDWLEANFPQWSKPVREQIGGKWEIVKESEIVGFDQAAAARALIEECARRGIFDPAGKMRGAGAHRQRGGGLVLHCGNKLLASRHYATTGELRDWKWHDPGFYEGFVYTAAAPIPWPDHEPAHPASAEKLLKLLHTWHWKRRLLDPMLVMGAIGASLIGGALPWRPHVWITGGRGTGKSTLNGSGGVLDELFGAGQFRTGNSSAAAIRQSLQNSTVPVAIDEIEASDNNNRAIEVIETARISSSGDKMHRGGQDHQAHEFTLRSVFWCSSINIPPLKPQDRSRFAVVELKPLKDRPLGRNETGEPPVLSDYHLPQLGQALLRRMIDGWARLEATKAKFHGALAAIGHDARACDQFGTLLACADLLLYDRKAAPDDEHVAHWATVCRPDRMAEIGDEVPDHIECLRRLVTSEVQARGGDEREALGTWIGEAVAYEVAPLLQQGDPARGDEKADKRLQQRGLKLVNAHRKASGEWGTRAFDCQAPGFLAVADGHEGVGRLFAGSKWQAGVWSQSLRRCEGAIERVDVKFAHGRKSRATLVPLWLVMDDDELPNASKREAAEAWLREHEKGAEA